jgi:hypothetical protein
MHKKADGVHSDYASFGEGSERGLEDHGGSKK